MQLLWRADQQVPSVQPGHSMRIAALLNLGRGGSSNNAPLQRDSWRSHIPGLNQYVWHCGHVQSRWSGRSSEVHAGDDPDVCAPWA